MYIQITSNGHVFADQPVKLFEELKGTGVDLVSRDPGDPLARSPVAWLDP
jgi:hypothetical protein